jgi:hypothetical protein
MTETQHLLPVCPRNVTLPAISPSSVQHLLRRNRCGLSPALIIYPLVFSYSSECLLDATCMSHTNSLHDSTRISLASLVTDEAHGPLRSPPFASTTWEAITENWRSREVEEFYEILWEGKWKLERLYSVHPYSVGKKILRLHKPKFLLMSLRVKAPSKVHLLHFTFR